MNRILLTFLLLGAAAIWGWAFVVVKDAVVHYGVVPFLAVRFTIATAALAAIAARRATRRTWFCGGLIGVVLAAGYLAQTFGLVLTTPSNAGLITGLFVVLVPLINLILFRVRIGPVLWGAIGASTVGLALLTGDAPAPFNKGDFVTLAAAALFALQIVLIDRHAKGHDGLALALGQIAGAGLLFMAAWLVTGPFVWPTPHVWFALVMRGGLATAAGFTVQIYAQRILPAARAAVIMATEPLFAVVFGYWLAGDRLTAIQMAGGAVMIAAVLAAELASSWKPAAYHP